MLIQMEIINSKRIIFPMVAETLKSPYVVASFKPCPPLYSRQSPLRYTPLHR